VSTVCFHLIASSFVRTVKLAARSNLSFVN
jgi:hypothetical protein